jgi:hypothetical protein
LLLLLFFFWHDSSPSSATQRKHLGYDGRGDTEERKRKTLVGFDDDR